MHQATNKETLVGVISSGAQAKSALGDAPCLAWEFLATELQGPERQGGSMDRSSCVLMHKHGHAGFFAVTQVKEFLSTKLISQSNKSPERVSPAI